MRVQCAGCHKKFNYEKYDGICPHCGTYIQKDPSRERIASADTEKKPVKKKRAAGKLKIRQLWLTVFFLILFPLLGIPTAKWLGQWKYERTRVGILEPETLNLEEQVRIGGYGFTVTGYKWKQSELLKERGQRLLQVWFSIYPSQWRYDDSYLSETASCYVCADGQYYTASTEKDLYLQGVPYKEMEEESYTEQLNQQEGSISFLIPEDAETISFILAEYDGAIQQNAVLLDRYEIVIEEVEDYGGRS